MTANTAENQPNIVSVRAAGKLLGVSHTAVQKAIAAGRLVRCVVRAGGNVRIDAGLIAAEWAANTDRRRSEAKGVTIAAEVERGAGRTRAPRPPAGDGDEEAGAFAIDDDGQMVMDFNASRRVEANFKARIAKLEYEQKSGRLVEAEKVRAEAFKEGRRVRDAILNIPERVSAQLAAETDPHGCFLLLTRELTEALQHLAAGESHDG